MLHNTWIRVDEEGTEAAATTVVALGDVAAPAPWQEEPIEVRVDRPFVFAIRDVLTGALLFVGRVTHPQRF